MHGLLSDARLSRYLDHYHGNERAALRLYTWNLRVASAFWGPLSILEVVVRNALHTQLSTRCRRDDWWEHDHLYLCSRERESIDSTLDTLKRRGMPEPTANDVVAATSFGLWVGLTGAGIPRDPIYSYETALWQPRLVKAFPNAHGVRRKQIHAHLRSLQILRNRIAHHEPIFNAPHAQLLGTIRQVVGYVHPDARAYIERHERVTEALSSKQAVIVDDEPGF